MCYYCWVDWWTKIIFSFNCIQRHHHPISLSTRAFTDLNFKNSLSFEVPTPVNGCKSSTTQQWSLFHFIRSFCLLIKVRLHHIKIAWWHFYSIFITHDVYLFFNNNEKKPKGNKPFKEKNEATLWRKCL